MTSKTLEKYRTTHYNADGVPESVTLNLKNKKFFEVLMEDFLDTIAVQEDMKKDDGTRYEMIFEGEHFSFKEINNE